MDNTLRTGFLTSSQASRLVNFDSVKMTADEKKEYLKDNPGSRKQNKQGTGFAAPGHTYIEEVHLERIMGRSIDTEINTRPVKWGSVMEIILFNMLSTEWTMTHKQTTVHPVFSKFWSGTPDFVAVDKIAEAKCYQPKKFAQLSRCLLEQDVQLLKEEFKEEYWQCVSNCCITNKKKAVMIAFMPYRKQLEAIIQKISETNFLEKNNLNPDDYYFMRDENIETMAFLPDDSKMSNINSFEFDVPKEDIILLENRMIQANKELNKLSELE